MPFSEIINKSFKYPWKNRALWFYGILAALFAGGTNISNSYNPTQEEMNQISDKIKNLDWLPSFNTVEWVILVIIFVVVVVALTVLSLVVITWAQTAINRGVELIENGKKIDRKKIGKTGKKVIWKMLVLSLFIPFAIIFSLIAFIVLGVVLISLIPSPFSLYIGIPVGIIAFFGLIVGIFYMSVLWPMATRFVTNDDKNAIESLKLAADLIKGKYWLTLGFNIVMGIISSSAAFVAIVPLLILVGVAVLFVIGKIYVGAIICGILAILYLVPLLIASGYFQAFILTGATLWWLELKKIKTAPKAK